MAGLLTATLVDSTRINLETFSSGEADLTYDEAIMVDIVVPIAATVAVIPIQAFTAANLVFLRMISDQDITLTFTLGTGSLVVALKAGIPWRWFNTYHVSIPNPFLYNNVSVAAANASGVAATLQVRGGLNAS